MLPMHVNTARVTALNLKERLAVMEGERKDNVRATEIRIAFQIQVHSFVAPTISRFLVYWVFLTAVPMLHFLAVS